MGNLVILGNGFDIASGLHTKYSHFRKWFIENHDLNYEELDTIVEGQVWGDVEVPEMKMGHHGETVYDERMDIFFYVMIEYANDGDETWSQFETNLARLPFYDSYYWEDDEDDDDNDFKKARVVEDAGTNLAQVFVDAVNYNFCDWIHHVYRSEKPRNDKKVIYNRRDAQFLVFNYTNVLETVYGITQEHICNIHGCVNHGDDLIVGHGKEIDYDGKEFDPFNIDYYIREAEETLRKPVERQLQKYKAFFNKLGHLENIHIIGWNLYNPYFVDSPYLQEIIKHTDSQTIIYFDEFDLPCIDIFINTCKVHGYEGKYGICNSLTGEERKRFYNPLH